MLLCNISSKLMTSLLKSFSGKVLANIGYSVLCVFSKLVRDYKWRQTNQLLRITFIYSIRVADFDLNQETYHEMENSNQNTLIY